MKAPKLQDHDRVAIVGKTGSGKSYFGKQCLGEWHKTQRIVAFDVCDELSEKGLAGEGPLAQRCTVDELLRNPSKWLDRHDLSLAVVPEGDDRETAQQFDAVAEQVKHTGRLLFYIEEVGYFQAFCQSRLNEAATLWRKRKIPIVFVAQRMVQIPLTARAQLSQLVSFLQTEVDDVAALNKLCGPTDPTFAEAVSRLPRWEFKHWRDGVDR